MKRQPMIRLHPRTQRGAIMVVSLLLLLVMTVLALTASQTTTLQERMAGNARDTDLAFQAAEAGLRDAEASLAALARAGASGKPDDCDANATCVIKQRNVMFKPDFARADTFWNDNTRQYAGAEKQIAEVTSDPLIFTEKRGEVRDQLSTGTPGGSGTAYYAHTVRAKGGTDTATVVLQSVDAVRYAIR
jgi:type IV pilus assembly protein PilX